MSEYFLKFFDTAGFPPRWYCGKWSDFLGWLHIVSDLAVFGAYFAIPAVLVYFARKRQDFPFSKLFWLFAAFILACGSTHLIDAIIFWHPIYRISGLMKLVTAIVSWVTVVALVRYVPGVLHFPSLAQTNERLKSEIFQRSQTELRLQESLDRHNALIEGTRSVVWTTDPAGNFATPQPSWQKYTGQSWEQSRGYGWTQAVHEDDLPGVQRSWQHSVSSGEKYHATARLWHHPTQSYRAFVAEAVPVYQTDGRVREWVGTINDIEDQQQAELALGIAQADLLKQKRELELIYEAAPVGLSLIDRNHRFLRINKTLARINGFSVQQHIGARAEDLLPELRDQIYPIYDEVFATGKPKLNLEIVGRTPASDQTRTWLASYYPLHGSSGEGEVTAVNAIVQDITRQKRNEQRLLRSEAAAQAANRSKSEFLANMSHEIRTPMAAILGYADVLLGHLQDPDNRGCVQVIKRNGEHLLELINDILDLSRIEAGKLDVETETVHLPQLIADIQSLMAVRAEEKDLPFEVEFQGRVPRTIQTDPTRLRQILINLIGNAIKFTQHGEVRLRVRLIDDLDPPVVEFAVVDTGIGMNDEQVQRLFKPFSQGDSSVTRQYGGSGLGLAISQRLTHLLDGSIDLRSQEGVGSTFTVRLPVASLDGVELIEPNLIVRDQQPDVTPQHLPTLHCRVLIVDDRRDVRHISQHFLEKAGATVTAVENGQQGIDAAVAAQDRGEPLDLIVMDMQMPVMDGLQATAQLRSLGIRLPIIALTADAMKGDRDKCLAAGCDDYLSKPIDHAKLVRMVATYTQHMSSEELDRSRSERLRALKATLSTGDDRPPEIITQ